MANVVESGKDTYELVQRFGTLRVDDLLTTKSDRHRLAGPRYAFQRKDPAVTDLLINYPRSWDRTRSLTHVSPYQGRPQMPAPESSIGYRASPCLKSREWMWW